MKKIFILSLFLSFNSSSALWAKEKSDSGINYPKYSNIVNSLVELNLNFPLKTKLITLGKTKHNYSQYALLYSNQFPPKNLMLITGATHGNEYLNIVDRLTTKIITSPTAIINQFLVQGGAILFVPIVNPEGFIKRKRSGGRNMDLNRDYPNSAINLKGLKNQEIKNLVNYIKNLTSTSQTNLLLAVDYHCCNGSLLYPWSYTKSKIPEQDLEDHRKIAAFMQEYFPSYIHGITGEVLGYFPKGTSKDYWYQEYNALAFTFEGKRNIEYSNLQKHFNWWNKIIKNFN